MINKFQRKYALPDEIFKNDKCHGKSIGAIANFDVFSDLISELYKECKHKKAVKSFILQSLSIKLAQVNEEVKVDPDLSFQEPRTKNNQELIADGDKSLSTTSDTVPNTGSEGKSKPMRKRPKRKGGRVTSLTDIL